MTNLTVVTRGKDFEEVAGKSLREVLVLASRLGHEWPAKSERRKGVWINTYRVSVKNSYAA